MERFDAVVIGGGVLGCFAARNLCRYRLSVLLLEAREDLCLGITRANTAIVYPGYDNRPGSRKAAMCVRGNRAFAALCRELDVPFSRCGSLMLAEGEKGIRMLHRKLKQGQENGVDGLRLLTGEEARALEPMLSPTVKAALYAPTTGTVNPWQLGIAAYENAMKNGLEARFQSPVRRMERDDSGYVIHTDSGAAHARSVINCAGCDADRVQEMLFSPGIRIERDAADFLVLDRAVTAPSHILFQEREDGKGITLVPTTEGNLLLDSPGRAQTMPFAASFAGMEAIKREANKLLPSLEIGRVIRSFGGVRPNPRTADERSLHDFCIENPEAGFYSLIGIKTPGLTCADELGKLLAGSCAAFLKAEEKNDFDPQRRGIHREDGEIICQCEAISRGAIEEAIDRGATTVEGIKRRIGVQMGACQGSRCTVEIENILREYRHGAI